MKKTKKISSSSLVLKKESVRNLSAGQMTRAGGGMCFSGGCPAPKCDPGCSHTLWTKCGFPESNM